MCMCVYVCLCFQMYVYCQIRVFLAWSAHHIAMDHGNVDAVLWV